MNSFFAKLIAFCASIVIFFLVGMPIGMLMALCGGPILILALPGGYFCFYVANKGYKWILNKILKRSDKETVLNVEEVNLPESKEDQVIDSVDIK